jgi:outer membrane immunogenic protein
MRRVLFTTISLLALTATSTLAADLPRAMPPYKAPALAPVVYNWTGFYLGVNGGGAFGKSNWDAFGSSNEPDGGLIGFTAGYNWQMGNLVFGLEGDMDWSSMRDTFTNAACATGCRTSNHWLSTVRGRLGYAMDRWMPYITGGAAIGDIRATQIGVASTSDTNVGWTIGAGLETAVAANWTAKLEYLYVDLGDVNCAACAPATNVDLQAHLIRAGLNLRF